MGWEKSRLRAATTHYSHSKPNCKLVGKTDEMQFRDLEMAIEAELSPPKALPHPRPHNPLHSLSTACRVHKPYPLRESYHK